MSYPMSTHAGPYYIRRHTNPRTRELTEFRYLVNGEYNMDGEHKIGPFTSDYEAELALSVANFAYAQGHKAKRVIITTP